MSLHIVSMIHPPTNIVCAALKFSNQKRERERRVILLVQKITWDGKKILL